MADNLPNIPPYLGEILKKNTCYTKFQGKLNIKFGMSARVNIALDILSK